MQRSRHPQTVAGLRICVDVMAALARAHPDIVVDHFSETLTGAARRERGRLLQRWTSAFGELCRSRPEALVNLVASVDGAPSGILEPWLPALLRREPQATGTYLSAIQNRGTVLRSRPVQRALPCLDIATLRVLADRVALDEHPLAKLLRSVAPSLRADLLNASIGNQSPQDLVVGDEVLMALSATARTAHVRRMLGLRVIPAIHHVHCSSPPCCRSRRPRRRSWPPPWRLTPSNGVPGIA